MNPEGPAQSSFFQARPGVVIAFLILAVVAWGYGQKLLNEHRRQAEFEAKDAAARRGNPVLTVPQDLSVGAPSELAAVQPCGPGSIDGPEYSTCFGQGSLLGIPGYLTVEWTSQHQLHSLSYDYQVPSAKVLISRLVQLYGAPHRFDGVTDPAIAMGLCWPLPPGQGVVVMEKSGDEKDRDLSVRVESQVAASLHQLL